jgi:hypothetical protein
MRALLLALPLCILTRDQVIQLKELEAENTRLRRTIADLRIHNLFLQEAVHASPSLYHDH